MTQTAKTPAPDTNVPASLPGKLAYWTYAGAYTLVSDILSLFGIHDLNIRKNLSLNAEPFIHPTDAVKPSVRADTRTAWEVLANTGYHLSPTMNPEATLALRDLLQATFTKTRQEGEAFRVEKLTGITASKTNHHNNPEWASLPNLAELGKRCVLEYRDAQGKNSQERIDYFANWEGFAQKEDLDVFADTWHNGRMYLSNSGGSHHLAMLCHELNKSGTNMVMPATITMYDINYMKADTLQRQFACYLVKNRKIANFGRLINLPSQMKNSSDHDYDLGISTASLGHILQGSQCLPLEDMHVVFIDRKAKYARHAIQMMTKACVEGRASELFDAIHKTSTLSDRPARFPGTRET